VQWVYFDGYAENAYNAGDWRLLYKNCDFILPAMNLPAQRSLREKFIRSLRFVLSLDPFPQSNPLLLNAKYPSELWDGIS
jgi:hypothetical protein